MNTVVAGEGRRSPRLDSRARYECSPIARSYSTAELTLIADGASLLLWVTDPGALVFYERCGFRDDGRREPLPHTPAVLMVGMSRPLRSS